MKTYPGDKDTNDIFA